MRKDDMTEEQAILERSKDRVAEIMGDAVLAGVPTEITKPRRTRSDAGTKRPKPEVERAPVFIETPGIRFDVATMVGRDALKAYVASGVTISSSIDWEIMEQLMKHIDRLMRVNSRRGE